MVAAVGLMFLLCSNREYVQLNRDEAGSQHESMQTFGRNVFNHSIVIAKLLLGFTIKKVEVSAGLIDGIT